jgi:type VI secretion system secreted protein VgrG
MARKFTFKILGSDSGSDIDLRVAEFTAHEWISAPYIVNLKLASRDEIDFNKVIAKEALLTIWGNDQSEERYFHGIINKFIKTGSEGRFFFYEAVMVPDMWRLTLMQDCRIFQGLPVLRKKESTPIVKQILKDANILSDRYEIRTQESYDNRDYCAQYRETDLNFISRILEEEGIFYFFEHSNDKHLLVFGDSTACYKPIPGMNNEVEFRFSDAMVSEEDFVYGFKLSQQIHSGKVSLRDFDFLSPSMFPTDEKEDFYNKLEIYDYPGGYIKNETANEVDKATIKKDLAQIRLQEAAIFAERAEGESVCPRFAPGHAFTLTKHDEFADPEYVLIEVIHTGNQPQVLEERSGHRDKGFSYTNSFIGIPSTTPFRPQRKTPKAVVRGPQTAIVVNSSGSINPQKNYTDGKDTVIQDEINTDEYGRVKVRFPWERPYKENNNDKWHNTAWVRVSQAWAGQGWGSMHIPHVGQEVIVDFLEGNPDRPIITGRVYNGSNQPHHNTTNDTMQPEKNPRISGFRDEYGNELIFDATPDNPQIRLGNPKHNYLVINPSGTDQFTDRDKVDGVFGNLFEFGAGIKLEALAGLGIDLKAGSTLEAMIGQAWQFFVGGKHTFEWSYVIEHSHSKKFSSTESDILSLSKDDQLHAAGDGFCVAGGTKKSGAVGDTNNSIINAYKDALMLSYGKKVSPVDDVKTLGAAIYSIVLGLLTLPVAIWQAVGSNIPELYNLPDHGKASIRASATTLSGIILAILNLASMAIFKKMLTNAKKAEPVFHDEVEALIALNKEGITFGIKPENPNAEDEWHNKIAHTILPNTSMKSKMLMNKDGSISINSNGESKKIKIGAGEPNKTDSAIVVDNEKIGLISGKNGIRIDKDSHINITTKPNNSNISLNAGNGNVNIKGTIDLAGSKFTKQSVEILKSLKVM